MRRGTTPTVTFTVTSGDESPLDLTQSEVHVTFEERKKGGVEITKEGDDVLVSFDGEKSTVSVTLTQEDTLSFTAGKSVRAQIRSKRGSTASATGMVEFDIEDVLLEGEI